MKKNITDKIQGHKWTPCGELHADAQSLLALCKILKEENPYMRLGQIAFNVCDIWWPDSRRVFNGRLQGMTGGHDSALREIIRLQEEIGRLKTKIRELEAALDERRAYAKMLEDDLNDGRD